MNSRRGFGALIWVMAVLAILIVMITHITHRVDVEEAIVDGERLERLAEIAFGNAQTMAIWHLEYDRRVEVERTKARADDKPSDSLEDVWNLGPQRPWADPDDPRIVVRWRLVDADSLLPLSLLGAGTGLVNEADRERLVNFMVELQQPEAENLVLSFCDWVDRAPSENLEGEVSGDPNVFEGGARNAPLSMHSELMMIPGFNGDVLWGSAQTDQQGFSNWTSLHGSGRLNANTAPAWVIRGMHNKITPTVARAIQDGRGGQPYVSIEEVLEAAGPQEEGVDFKPLFSVVSNHFILEMEADYRGRRLKRRVFLLRSASDGTVSVVSIERRGYFRWGESLRETMDDAVKELLEDLKLRNGDTL